MKHSSLLAGSSLALLVLIGASGCLNLKPKSDPIRYFMLHPIPGSVETARESSSGLRLGIAPVTVPNYLTKPWIVIRSSDTELRYADYYKWAEYLDKGVQRVLAEDLAYLLETDQIQMNSWRREDVDVEVKVMVQRFDVDDEGRVVLEVFWQLNGNRASSGHHAGTLEGPTLAEDPSGAAETMSRALNDLSRTLAGKIQP
jgi:uncharacterized lipoprotein YmbA